MAKTKKFLSAVLATSIAVCSTSAINVLAADNAPQIYVDIVYEDANTARADVIFKNMPELCEGGFYVGFGEGWTVNKTSGGNVSTSKYKRTISECNASAVTAFEEYNSVLLAFANDYNYNLNGTFVSIYITKTDNSTPENLTSNIWYNSNCTLSAIDADKQPISYIESTQTPEMLNAYEYIIGDTNGDHIVTMSDASRILSATSENPILSVYDMRYSYKDFFKYAECAAAPDADQSGYVTKDDANAIMEYYVATGTESEYEGSVGSKNVFEIYNN